MARFTVIMSANINGDAEALNNSAHIALRRDLTRRVSTIVECFGVYQGCSEKSFAVPLDNMMQVQNMLFLAQDYGQEAILVVDNLTKKAQLMFTDSIKTVELGNYCKTTGWDVRANNLDHTYFPEANTYFTCRT